MFISVFASAVKGTGPTLDLAETDINYIEICEDCEVSITCDLPTSIYNEVCSKILRSKCFGFYFIGLFISLSLGGLKAIVD